MQADLIKLYIPYVRGNIQGWNRKYLGQNLNKFTKFLINLINLQLFNKFTKVQQKMEVSIFAVELSGKLPIFGNIQAKSQR